MAISVQVQKDLSGIKTKVALNLTKRQIICFSGAAVADLHSFPTRRSSDLDKETDHLFQRCGSSRDTLVFFNQGTDRNISRITSYDGSNASVLLFCDV